MKTFASYVFLIGVVFLVLALVYHELTKKYLNPWKLIFVFAKKGSGKTTYLTKEALKHLKRGWTVYSTEPIPGCYLIDPDDIGYAQFPPKSLLIIDEVGMIWDSRDYAKFPKPVRNFFKLQRHYKVKVIMASQNFDVDKKLRDLADDMFLLQKKFRVISYGKRILKFLDIVEADGNTSSESRIVDQLQYDSLFFFWAGSRSLTFIPRWKNYFNSFAAPDLKPKDFPLVPSLPEKRFSLPRKRS